MITKKQISNAIIIKEKKKKIVWKEAISFTWFVFFSSDQRKSSLKSTKSIPLESIFLYECFIVPSSSLRQR